MMTSITSRSSATRNSLAAADSSERRASARQPEPCWGALCAVRETAKHLPSRPRLNAVSECRVTGLLHRRMPCPTCTRFFSGLTSVNVPEDEVDALASYFVETDQFRRIMEGDVDVVFGPKGAGKSAIYASVLSRRDDLFDRGVMLVAGELPRGAPAFSDLVADPPTSEREFVGLWKFYVLSLVNEVLEDFDVRSGPASVVRLYVVLIAAVILSMAGRDRQRDDIARRVRVLHVLGELLHHLGGPRRSPRWHERALVPGRGGALLPDLPPHLSPPSGGGCRGRWVQVAILVGLCLAIMVWRSFPVRPGRGLRPHLPRDGHPGRRDPLGSVPPRHCRQSRCTARCESPRRLVAAHPGAPRRCRRGLPRESLAERTGHDHRVHHPRAQSRWRRCSSRSSWRPSRSVGRRAEPAKAVAWVGIVSYAIYLIHRPALMLAEEYLHDAARSSPRRSASPRPSSRRGRCSVFVERPFGRLRRRANRAGETENDGRD